MLTPKQLALTAAAIFSAASADASVLLYEPFAYDTGNIVGKGGDELGFDAASTWTRNSDKVTEILAGSMDFGSLNTAGGKFHYDDITTQWNRYCDRPLDITAATGELYITFLMQGPGGNRLNGGVYINGSVAREFGALRTQYNFSGNNSNPNAPHVFYGGSIAVATSNPVTTTTYMYVQKYTGLGSASGGMAKLWLIDSSHYDAIAADGNATDAELDANSLLSTPLLTLAGSASTLDGTETLRLHCHDSGSGHSEYTLDEIRIATTLGEAMDIPPGSGTGGGPSLEITELNITPVSDPVDNLNVSITFRSIKDKIYSVFATDDLGIAVADRAEIDDSITGLEGTTTVEFDFNAHTIPLDAERQFFVVKENPPPPAP